jgi:hypothetical protein
MTRRIDTLGAARPRLQRASAVGLVAFCLVGACSSGRGGSIAALSSPPPAASGDPTRCPEPQGSRREVRHQFIFGKDDENSNEPTSITLAIGDVLSVTAKAPEDYSDVFVQPRLVGGPPGSVARPPVSRPPYDHVVLCRFSPDEGPSREATAKFLALAPGRTDVESFPAHVRSNADSSPTPSTPAPSTPGPSLFHGAGGSVDSPQFDIEVIVEPRGPTQFADNERESPGPPTCSEPAGAHVVEREISEPMFPPPADGFSPIPESVTLRRGEVLTVSARARPDLGPSSAAASGGSDLVQFFTDQPRVLCRTSPSEHPSRQVRTRFVALSPFFKPRQGVSVYTESRDGRVFFEIRVDVAE